MGFIVGILTAVLVLNSLVLILLVLIQLPKKDAGAGMAFGGGAADALFGAGSGNALTKITKYATVIFFVLALVLGYLEDQLHNRSNATAFEKQVQQKQMQTPVAPPPAESQPAATTTNNLLSVPSTTPGNVPATAPTNPPAASPQSK
jgi:preprotein translocase subunit SecG